MTELHRSDQGKFAIKGDAPRAVRSIRLTDATWNHLGSLADKNTMTRADFLEALVSGEASWENTNNCDSDVGEAVSILKEALMLKANAGSAIKKSIKDALRKLESGQTV
jgi:predicted DNA-binding ribbon-helix-helix protein